MCGCSITTIVFAICVAFCPHKDDTMNYALGGIIALEIVLLNYSRETQEEICQSEIDQDPSQTVLENIYLTSPPGLATRPAPRIRGLENGMSPPIVHAFPQFKKCNRHAAG